MVSLSPPHCCRLLCRMLASPDPHASRNLHHLHQPYNLNPKPEPDHNPYRYPHRYPYPALSLALTLILCLSHCLTLILTLTVIYPNPNPKVNRPNSTLPNLCLILCLILIPNPQTYTYRELHREVCKIANAMRASGVRKVKRWEQRPPSTTHLAAPCQSARALSRSFLVPSCPALPSPTGHRAIW